MKSGTKELSSMKQNFKQLHYYSITTKIELIYAFPKFDGQSGKN